VNAFENWCALRGVSALPARPATVAEFVTECYPLGVDRVWRILQEVSRAHRRQGVADPTMGPPVSLAMNELSRIEPPRSWPAGMKRRFLELPYDLQVYVNVREAERDRAVRQAQNAASASRKGKPNAKSKTDATAANPAANAAREDHATAR
jgi:hypothetical protein